MGGKGEIKDHRFVINYNGDPEYKMITRSSDGQMLFLVNKLSKMKSNTALGSRIAEVHNGSSLFTGDAGQGESNIRRWIIENDWMEAIVALPENLFYNTGIEAFFKREVLPYVPDAWIDESKTQIGYEISFTRYFYKPAQMRTLEEIMKDIRAIEKETDGLLNEIVGDGK